MSNLKKQLIRLGEQHPELQGHLAAVLDRIAFTDDNYTMLEIIDAIPKLRHGDMISGIAAHIAATLQTKPNHHFKVYYQTTKIPVRRSGANYDVDLALIEEMRNQTEDTFKIIAHNRKVLLGEFP